MSEQENMSVRQSDYAVFLPALSGFYSTVWGNVLRDPNYADHNGRKRIHAAITDIRQLDWLDQQHGLFTYKFSLYSAGHANLDPNNPDQGEVMVRNRDRANTCILGDSGGFQIGKGRWPGEWRDPNSAAVQQKLADLKAQGPYEVFDASKNKNITKDPYKEYLKQLAAADLKRRQVLKWMDLYMDYGMGLDIPSWVGSTPGGAEKTGISSTEEALLASQYNIEYWIQHRKGVDQGGCKFLNVLQGRNHKTADEWYDGVKKYCDPKQYPGRHFNGWAMGGQNMSDFHLVLKRIVTLIRDGLLQQGLHDWMHFLGTSRLEIALLLTDIMRAVRKYHNKNFTISFDCASPFLATANGQIYYALDRKDAGRWSYQMGDSVDSRHFKPTELALAFKDAFDRFKKPSNPFKDSPLTKLLTLHDICTYGPGDKNKIDKVGKTSWDSYSYLLQMNHNVWSHIDAVQKSNQRYYNEGNEIRETGREQDIGGGVVLKPAGRKDGRRFPGDLDMHGMNKRFFKISRGDKNIKQYDTMTDLVDDIIRTATTQGYDAAMKIVDAHDKHWMSIRGGRISGQKLYSADTKFEEYFEVDQDSEEDFEDDAYDRLERLEEGQELDLKEKKDESNAKLSTFNDLFTVGD